MVKRENYSKGSKKMYMRQLLPQKLCWKVFRSLSTSTNSLTYLMFSTMNISNIINLFMLRQFAVKSSRGCTLLIKIGMKTLHDWKIRLVTIHIKVTIEKKQGMYFFKI